jgi:hypothetical protein
VAKVYEIGGYKVYARFPLLWQSRDVGLLTGDKRLLGSPSCASRTPLDSVSDGLGQLGQVFTERRLSGDEWEVLSSSVWCCPVIHR